MADPICPPPSRRLQIGLIAKVRGLRGDLKIAPMTWDVYRFEELDGVWVEMTGQEPQFYTFKRMRIEGQAVYVRFKEAPLRELAEKLVGGEVFIDDSQRLELFDDMYYIDDLVGCKIVDETHGELGTVTGVIDQAAQDIWQVDGPFGEVLIPAVIEFIVEMDLENRIINVDLPDGLINETEEGSA